MKQKDKARNSREAGRYSRSSWPGDSVKIFQRWVTVGYWHEQSGGPIHSPVFKFLRVSLCSGLYGFMGAASAPVVRPHGLRYIAYDPATGAYWDHSAAEVPYRGW